MSGNNKNKGESRVGVGDGEQRASRSPDAEQLAEQLLESDTFFSSLVSDFVEGELDEADRNRLEERCATDPLFAADVTVTRGLIETLSAIEEDSAPPSLIGNVMRSIRIFDAGIEPVDIRATISTSFGNLWKILVPVVGLAIGFFVITSPAFQIPLEGSTPGVQIAGIDATPGNGSSSSSVSESIQAPDGLFRPVWTGGNFMINDQFRPESLSGKVLVYEGDTLQSPKDVKISLLHEGGSVIEIAQETKCVLQSNGLYLVDGKISAAIENMTPESFVVETTSARVTHLGTQFTVEMIDGDTRVEVVEGRVSVDSSTIDDKVLFPGQFARITGDGGISYGTIGQVESRMQPRTAPENIEVHFNP